MPTPTHSAKGLETLRLLGCTADSWALPPIEWQKVLMPVPTVLTCPTCHGTGQVADTARRAVANVTGFDRGAMQRCPACPPRRQWPNHSMGKITRVVEREVEVAHILWPEGTQFASRFGASGSQCELCGKRISWAVPVLGQNAAGVPQGLWVGDACARRMLAVANEGISMEVASARAAAAKAERKMWRELPTPPKPFKPAKPALVNPPSEAELATAARAALGPAFRDGYYTRSRAELTYTLYVFTGGPRSNIRGYELKVSARHGATVRCWEGQSAVLLKDRAQQDAVAALQAAAPAMLAHLRGGTSA